MTLNIENTRPEIIGKSILQFLGDIYRLNDNGLTVRFIKYHRGKKSTDIRIQEAKEDPEKNYIKEEDYWKERVLERKFNNLKDSKKGVKCVLLVCTNKNQNPGE